MLIKPKFDWNANTKIQIMGKGAIIQEIKDKLTLRQEVMFQESSFGYYLDIKMEKSKPQLLHHLIIRMFKTDNKEVLLFNIEGNKITSGIKKIAIIIGLRSSSNIQVDEKDLQ